jgi:hypothetical protein
MDHRPSTHLIARRRAAHTLNQLCKSLEFGAKAEYFDPEDHNQWTVNSENLVIARRNQTEIARIEMLEGSIRHLTIPRWDGLIRTEHLADFTPIHYNLVENTAADVLFHEKYPDSEGEVDFGDPPGLNLPPHPLVKTTRHRPPRVVM